MNYITKIVFFRNKKRQKGIIGKTFRYVNTNDIVSLNINR